MDLLTNIFKRLFGSNDEPENNVNTANEEEPVVDPTESQTSGNTSNTVNEEEPVVDPPESQTSGNASNTVNEEEDPVVELHRSSLDYLSISAQGNWLIPEKKRFGKKIPGPHFQQQDPASVNFNEWKTYEKCSGDGSYPKYPCRLKIKYAVEHKGHRVCTPRESKNCLKFIDGSINCNPEPSQTTYYQGSLLNTCNVEGPAEKYKGIIHLLPNTFQPPMAKG